MPEETKTESDAFRRVTTARIGSLADNPTIEYLRALHRYIGDWHKVIEEELRNAIKREANKRTNFENDFEDRY